MRIYEIIPNKLYVSRKTNDVPIEKKLPQLEELGIDVIVNMCCEKDEDLVYEMYEYISFYQPDGKSPNVEAYDRMAQYLVGKIEVGHVVLVHCKHGRNRSGFLAGVVVMYLKNISGKKARMLVQEKRPKSIHSVYMYRALDELELE